MASEYANRVMDMMGDDPKNFNPIHGIANAPDLSFVRATETIDPSFADGSLPGQVICAEMFAATFSDDDVLNKDQIRFLFFFEQFC